jgi:hypothetical protein
MTERTSDQSIIIEERLDGYVRYRRSDGLRWEVYGHCIQLGHCLIGANIVTPEGTVQVRDHAHIEELKRTLGRARIDSEMDVPVLPGFSGCCPLTTKVL